MKKKSDADISYIAFILGFDLLQIVLSESMATCDEAHDYCVELAKEFVGGEYDDESVPAYECLQNFVNDKMEDIEKQVEEYFGIRVWYRAE